MKILLQHNQTKAFFTAQDDWTLDISSARIFATTHDLLDFCAARQMEDAQMLVKFDDPSYDLTVPVVSGVSEIRSQAILLVEDNSDDVLLIQRAFRKIGINDSIHVVNDGEQAIAYLTGQACFSDRAAFPIPRLIVMDVKMPRMSGLELLQWMNSRENLRPIPKIVLSSSRLDSDITTAYDLGANTYFAKPSAFEDLLLLVKSIHDYWLMNEIPEKALSRSIP